MTEPAVHPAVRRLNARSLSFLVRQAHHTFVRALQVPLAAHQTTVAEWAVLRMLWQEDGLAPSELAARMRVRKATLTPTIDSLERKQRLTRQPDGQDRRKLRLALTPAGKALEGTLVQYGVRNNDIALRGIASRDLETARDVLERIISNLQANQ